MCRGVGSIQILGARVAVDMRVPGKAKELRNFYILPSFRSAKLNALEAPSPLTVLLLYLKRMGLPNSAAVPKFYFQSSVMRKNLQRGSQENKTRCWISCICVWCCLRIFRSLAWKPRRKAGAILYWYFNRRISAGGVVWRRRNTLPGVDTAIR